VQTLFPGIWGPSTNFNVQNLGSGSPNIKLSNVIDVSGMNIILAGSDAALGAQIAQLFPGLVRNASSPISPQCIDNIRGYFHCYDQSITSYNKY
jgi:hypothetical protein